MQAKLAVFVVAVFPAWIAALYVVALSVRSELRALFFKSFCVTLFCLGLWTALKFLAHYPLYFSTDWLIYRDFVTGKTSPTISRVGMAPLLVVGAVNLLWAEQVSRVKNFFMASFFFCFMVLFLVTADEFYGWLVCDRLFDLSNAYSPSFGVCDDQLSCRSSDGQLKIFSDFLLVRYFEALVFLGTSCRLFKGRVKHQCSIFFLVRLCWGRGLSYFED